MAQLAHTAVSDLRQAIREKRPAFVVGPARSGLTWLVNQGAVAGIEPVVRFSVRGIKNLDQLRTTVRDSLALTATPAQPSDLQLLFADLDSSLRPRLIVVNDCHLATFDSLSWLLEAAMDPLAGGCRTVIPFVFEGAFDPDLSLTRALPSGYSHQPLIHYAEPVTPWRVLSEVEEIIRGRWRQSFSPGLIPWIADVSGGDVGFVQELLERLPNEGKIRDETLDAAVRFVITRGFRAREIRDSISEVDDAELLRKAVSGRGLRGIVPSALETCALKKAYFAGILIFDGIAGVYRIRSPVTAHVVALAMGLDPLATVFEGRFILSRLLIFFAHIAAFELDVRSSLRDRDPIDLALRVSTETGLAAYRKKVRDAVSQTCAPTDVLMGRLSEVLKTVLPDSLPILEQIRSRLGEDPTKDAVLDGITFAQLVRLLHQAKLLSESDEPLLSEINNYRNAFAHFRAEPYGRCERLLQVIVDARRMLEQII